MAAMPSDDVGDAGVFMEDVYVPAKTNRVQNKNKDSGPAPLFNTPKTTDM